MAEANTTTAKSPNATRCTAVHHRQNASMRNSSAKIR